MVTSPTPLPQRANRAQRQLNQHASRRFTARQRPAPADDTASGPRRQPPASPSVFHRPADSWGTAVADNVRTAVSVSPVPVPAVTRRPHAAFVRLSSHRIRQPFRRDVNRPSPHTEGHCPNADRPHLRPLTTRSLGATRRLTRGHPPARLLDMQGIARVVPALSPETLRRVIDHSGLDEYPAALALASREQLHQVMDPISGWSEVAGLTKGFDISRFGAWPESPVDNGDAFCCGLARAHGANAGDQRPGGAGPRRRSGRAGVSTGPRDDEFRGGRDVDRRVCGHRRGTECAPVKPQTPGMPSLRHFVALETHHPRAFHQVMRGCRHCRTPVSRARWPDDLLSHRPQAWLDQQGRRLYDASDVATWRQLTRAYFRAARAVDPHAAAAPPQDLTWRAFLAGIARC